MQYYVYVLTNKTRGVLYVGVTDNLIRRVYEHKSHLVKGFTERYKTTKLVYYESTEDILSAISREKQLKKWYRVWKINLIETMNPNWDDLYNTLL